LDVKIGVVIGLHYEPYPNIILILTRHVNLRFALVGLNEIIGATRTIEGSAYWIALVVNWMQTLGSQPVMPKIFPITGTRGLPKP
jgi:hypothetical protein